jgi:cell fate regulator YaaT (PSP1 superfamily)
MGCGSCGTGSGDGKPSGCQSNGGCSTGGCNRLNVYNWLSDIPFSDLGKPYPIIEISFSNGSRKDFYRNNTNHIFEKGTWVAVEGAGGFDVGQISLTGELVKLQLKKYGVAESAEMKRVLRPAVERDLEVYNAVKQRERETLVRARAIAKELNLEMKIAEAEFQADGKKVTFFYTADSRVDFRELIKVYASDFRAKVEMRQIGARQESGKVGGIGSCGRELCCSTWLTDFKTVNTTAARYQNLSINQTKLSGQCGRLKCCLNYELDTYMDALHSFPEGVEQIEIATGRAYLQKKDIFRNLMWYSFGGSNKQYPLTIERVLEIQAMNAEGKKPEELEAVELQVKHKDPEKTVDMGFVNDVGQLTLSSLSKSGKKKQSQQNKQRQQQKPQQGKPQQQNKAQAPAPAEAGGEKPQANAGQPKPQQNRPPRAPRPQGPNQPQQQAGDKPQRPQQQAGERPPKPQQQQGDRPPRQPQQPGDKSQQKPQQQAGERQPRPPRPQGQPKPQQQAKPKEPGDGAANPDGAQANRPERQQQQRRKPNRPPQETRDAPGEPPKEQ